MYNVYRNVYVIANVIFILKLYKHSLIFQTSDMKVLTIIFVKHLLELVNEQLSNIALLKTVNEHSLKLVYLYNIDIYKQISKNTILKPKKNQG